MKNPLEPLAAIAAPVKDITELLNKFLSPALQEAGEAVGAHVRVFRLKQETKLLQKSISILEDAGLKPKPVSLRVLFPLLDAAVLEEDDQMAERWASLLASAANPNNQTGLEASFIEILKQLVPTHAFVLDVFYEQVANKKLPPEQWAERGFVFSDLKGFLQKEVPQFDVAIDNLLRLHLVGYPTPSLGIANGHEVRVQVTSSNILCATSLGHAFVTACGHGRIFRNHSYGIPGYDISNVYWTRGGSLKITPTPSPKLIPPGIIPQEQQLKIQFEAMEIAQKCGCVKPGAGLIDRRLTIHVGKNELPIERVGPLMEFCEDRGLKLEIYHT